MQIKISKNLFEILKYKFKINGRFNLNEKFLNESKLIQEIFMENGDSIEILASTLKFRISKKMSRFYYCLNEKRTLEKSKPVRNIISHSNFKLMRIQLTQTEEMASFQVDFKFYSF